MDHQLGVVGRESSPHKETPTAPCHGWIVVRQDKRPLAFSPLVGMVATPAWTTDPPPPSGGQWMSGQGGPRFRPPAQGNAGNWRPGWRSSSGDRGGPSPAKQQYPPGQRWGHDSTDQQPPVTANTPPPRRRGCYVCGHPGCHSDFRGPGAVSPGATSHRMLCVRPARMPLVPPGGRYSATGAECSRPANESSSGISHECSQSAVKLAAGLVSGRAGPAGQCTSTPSVNLGAACVSAGTQTDLLIVEASPWLTSWIALNVRLPMIFRIVSI